MPAIDTANQIPTISFYDWLFLSSPQSYTADDIIPLLNFTDPDGDAPVEVKLWLNENEESNRNAGLLVNGSMAALGEPIIFDIAETRANETVFTTLPSAGFSIVDAWISASDGKDYSEWEHYFVISAEEGIYGDTADNVLSYNVIPNESVLIEGGSGHDFLDLTIPDTNWTLLTTIAADDDNRADGTSYIVISSIEELNLTLGTGTNYTAKTDMVENVIIGDGDGTTYVKLNAGLSDTFIGGDLTDTLSGALLDVAMIYDAIDGTVIRGEITDYVQNFEFIVGTDFDDQFYGSNTQVISFADIVATLVDGSYEDFEKQGKFEAFIGGKGNDTIVGRDGLDLIGYIADKENSLGIVANLTEGTIADNFGNIDTVSGIEGIEATVNDDVIIGDAHENYFSPEIGSDSIDGRAGDDFVAYSGDNFDEVGVVVNLSSTTTFLTGSGAEIDLTNGATYLNGEVREQDTLSNIEGVIGSDHQDWLIGNEEQNYLFGLGGNDTIIGGAGSDHLGGGSGDDTIKSISDADLIHAGSGDDTIELTTDKLYSSTFVAWNAETGEQISIAGMSRYETVSYGEEGVDTIQLMDQENGDAFFLHDAYSEIYETLALQNDGLGRESVPRISGIEGINSGSGSDLIDLTSPVFDMKDTGVIVDGGTGDDTIWGSSGNDTLIGSSGNDTIFDGDGNDRLHGGDGSDVFQFASTTIAQIDTIVDYTAEDTLKLYLTDGEQPLTNDNIQNGNLVWGSHTVQFEDYEVNSLSDLNIVYDGAEPMQTKEIDGQPSLQLVFGPEILSRASSKLDGDLVDLDMSINQFFEPNWMFDPQLGYWVPNGAGLNQIIESFNFETSDWTDVNVSSSGLSLLDANGQTLELIFNNFAPTSLSGLQNMIQSFEQSENLHDFKLSGGFKEINLLDQFGNDLISLSHSADGLTLKNLKAGFDVVDTFVLHGKLDNQISNYIDVLSTLQDLSSDAENITFADISEWLNNVSALIELDGLSIYDGDNAEFVLSTISESLVVEISDQHCLTFSQDTSAGAQFVSNIIDIEGGIENLVEAISNGSISAELDTFVNDLNNYNDLKLSIEYEFQGETAFGVNVQNIAELEQSDLDDFNAFTNLKISTSEDNGVSIDVTNGTFQLRLLNVSEEQVEAAINNNLYDWPMVWDELLQEPLVNELV